MNLQMVVLFALLSALITAAWLFYFAGRGTGRISVGLVYAGMMAAVQIVLTELMLGATGRLRLPPLIAANVVCSFGLILWTWRGHSRLALRRRLRRTGAAMRALVAWENGLLALLIAFITGWLTVAAVFLPPRGIDDLVYHLPPIYQAVQTQRIELLPLELRDLFAFPLNGELLFLWPLVFFHDDQLIDLVQLGVALYGVLVLYAMARQFEVAPRTAFFVACLFLCTPVVLGQVGSNYVDVIAAVLHLVLLVAIVSLHRSGDFLHLAVAGVATGFGAGVKYSMLIYLAALQPLLWLCLRRGGGINRAARRYAVYFLLALPGCAYWFVRNQHATGNPFYPIQILMTGFRFDPESTLAQITQTDAPTVLADLAAHPGKLLAYPFLDPGLGSLHGGFGVIFWGLGVPALVYCMARAARTAIHHRRLFPLLFWSQVWVAVVAFVLQSSEALAFSARYVLFVVGLGLVALGIAFSRLAELPACAPLLRAWCVGACVLATIHLAGYQWPSYRIHAAVEDWIHERQTSEYRYLRQSGWDLPSLSQAWEPLDYLTRGGAGWSVYMACGYRVFWTTPTYGSHLQNRIWNFDTNATEWPDAFVFHRDGAGGPLHFVGTRITPEEVQADDRYALVTHTPQTTFWVKRQLLKQSDVSARLARYYATRFAPAVRAAESIAPLFSTNSVVITASPLGYGLAYLALVGRLPVDVHLVPNGQEDVLAARLGASTVYTVGQPLAGYQSRVVAMLANAGGTVPVLENRMP